MKNKEIKGKAHTALISIIAVLSITVGVLVVHIHSLDNKVEKEKISTHTTQSELTKTYQKLDELSLQLETQINQIKEYGGRVDSLLEIKKQLEHDKYQLQLSKNITIERYQEIKKTVVKYEMLIDQKDREIVLLQEKHQQLTSKYDSLQGTAAKLSEHKNRLEDKHKNLVSKVASASILQVINFNLKAIDKGGKERIGREHKVRHVDKLHVRFALAENLFAELGSRKIYLRIIEPDGKVLFNTNTGSGKFKDKNGVEKFYTVMQEILFDNSKQEISYLYKKGNNFKKGTHKIQIFCQGHQIGNTTFRIK